MKTDIILAILWIIAFMTIWYKDGFIFKSKKWTFVPCTSPSNSRKIMSHYVNDNKGTQYRLTVIDNCYGFEYR